MSDELIGFDGELLAGDDDGDVGMGEDWLMGLGLSPEDMLLGLGARRKPHRNAALLRARGMAALAAGRTRLPAGVKIRANRHYPLAIVSPGAAMAAGATVIFQVTPLVPFQPRHFQINDQVVAGPLVIGAAFWTINDIRVGKNPQSPNPGALGGSSFSNVAVGSAFKFDFCPASIPITFSVTLSAFAPAALNFSATLWGDAADQ